MIDKQKLIKWVEDEIYVLSGPYDDNTPEEIARWKAKVQMLRLLERDIASGEFDAADDDTTVITSSVNIEQRE